MLQILREGTKAAIKADLRVPTWDDRCFPFYFECGGEAYAGLLTQALRYALGKAVEEARREAYAQGWRDAKAKTARRQYFGSKI